MANLKIRHLVEKPGRAGPRFFWQPSAKLRQAGFKPLRLPDDRAKAIAKAEELNAQLDRWRMGETIDNPAQPSAKILPGSMSDLIARYKQDRRYLSKAETTRKGYDWFLKVIEAWWGQGRHPVADLTAEDVQELYETYREKAPVKAVALIRVLRLLLQQAVRFKMISANPASKPELETKYASTGKLWPLEAVRLFVDTADQMGRHSLGTAIMLAWWTGQRQGDVLRLSRACYRNGVFHVTQRKTGQRVMAPHSPIIQARIEEELARRAKRADDAEKQGRKLPESPALVVSEDTGLPYKEDNFRHQFAILRARAAQRQASFETPEGTISTRGLLFMWLRHTAITELAQAGATVPEIAAISGHAVESVETILNRYLVRTKALAVTATQKRLAWLGEQGQGLAVKLEKLDS